MASSEGVALDIRGQVVDGRLDPATRTISFLPIGRSFHADEVGPFEAEPPGACVVTFDVLTRGKADGEIDCTLTASQDGASVHLTGTVATQ